MRKAVVRIAVVLLVGGLAACQGGGGAPAGLSEADRAAVQKLVVDDAIAALGARNFEAFANTYAEDAGYLPPNGPALKGRPAILSFLQAFPPYSDFKAGAVTLDGSGNMAYVHGTFSMMVTQPGASAPTKDEGKWVVAAKKQANGTWKSVVGIWNSDLPVAAPPPPAPAKK